MSTTITLVYKTAQGGQSLSALSTAVAAVPVPQDELDLFGARVTSDSTAIVGSEVVRTIVLSIVPSSGATATAIVNSNGELDHVTVTAAGAGYTHAPIVQFTGAESYKSAIARASLKAVAVASFVAGSGYSSSTIATVVGHATRPAKVTLTIGGGGITGVAITDPGAGYTDLPTVVITDPGGGSGGSVTLSMGIDTVDVAFKGQGYESVPAVSFLPFFKTLFPDGNVASQASAFGDLMTVAIAQAALTPVVAALPVVS